MNTLHWFPKSRIGKVAFWMAIAAFVLLHAQYWLAMLFRTSIIWSGLLVMACLLAAGVLAFVKKKDYASLLIIPVLFGLFMVVGELIFTH